MPTKKQILSALEHTKRPAVRITPEPDKTPGPTDSKFGGDYCLPAGADAPEMEFLAQINFAQLPRLEGFPQKGLLQFFLCTEEEAFEGFLEDDSAWRPDSGFFQVRWYPEVPADSPAYPNAVPEARWAMDKVTGGMKFSPAEEIATLALGEEGFFFDLGFEDAITPLTQVFMEKKRDYDLSDCGDTDQFCRDFGNWGFQLGGHPALRQAEFRLDDEAFQAYTVLLFQYDLTVPDPEDPMDLEKDTFCFFIKPEDLNVCRFDDILMVHHNCY